MNTGSSLSITIVVLFFLASFIWSALRTGQSHGLWRVLHGTTVVLMIGASYAVLTGSFSLGVIVGITWLMLALIAMFKDASRWRWLAFVQFFLAMLLAAGVPFVTG